MTGGKNVAFLMAAAPLNKSGPTDAEKRKGRMKLETIEMTPAAKCIVGSAKPEGFGLFGGGGLFGK